jgi:hypothetical protein
VARLGLAALAYRDSHGAWPESAADLAPLFTDAVSVDPFTREPFVFVREGDALRIECGQGDRDRVSWTLE